MNKNIIYSLDQILKQEIEMMELINKITLSKIIF